jgi:hypothetical protein
MQTLETSLTFGVRRRRPLAAFAAASSAVVERSSHPSGSTLLIALPFPEYVPALVTTAHSLGLRADCILPETARTDRAALYTALASRLIAVLVTSEHLPRDFPYRRVDRLVLIEPDGTAHTLTNAHKKVTR